MYYNEKAHLSELKKKLEDAEKELKKAHDLYRAAEEECDQANEAYQNFLDERG